MEIRYALSNNIGLGRPQRRRDLQALRRRLTPSRRVCPSLQSEPMPDKDPARRAVVTGLGAVMPIGNDFPTYWANLLAGVTGTRTIRSFDASQHEVRIAAEVLDFDPASVMEPKMARRMSRFIHFGDGRRQGSGRRLGHRLRGDDPGAARPRRGRREHRRRRHRADHRRHPRPRPEGAALRVAVRGPGAVGLDGARRCCRWSGG